MKRSFNCLRRTPHVIAVLLLILSSIFLSSESVKSEIIQSTQEDISLKKEVKRAFQNGFEFLKTKQNPDGSWSNPDFPALTGLVISAFLNSSEYAATPQRPDFIQKGLDFIIRNAKENGSIYKEILPNYNTAICMMALMAANDAQYYPYVLRARKYLISLQADKGQKGVADDIYDGGIGYGTKDHPDLSNTYVALEGLKMTEILESDQHLKAYTDLQEMRKKTLNWDAALKFIQRCQNLPGSNDQSWASDDPDNKGGFVYYPGNSKAGEQHLSEGKVALRSYGSMTYAGLLSLIYADLKKDDSRVTAAYKWIQKNYTLTENPGLGQQGLYYYYHTMAKALTVFGEDYLKTADGHQIDWRKDLTIKFVELQKGDGSWVNDSGRWWENDPILVTSYALIAMNMISFCL
ncbi:MAG: terpene cyclase/mutase family protein [Desulfobacterales bacterium]|nr:terpene cyclase/mutase family protein [Desulfobacterales bacterium]